MTLRQEGLKDTVKRAPTTDHSNLLLERMQKRELCKGFGVRLEDRFRLLFNSPSLLLTPLFCHDCADSILKSHRIFLYRIKQVGAQQGHISMLHSSSRRCEQHSCTKQRTTCIMHAYPQKGSWQWPLTLHLLTCTISLWNSRRIGPQSEEAVHSCPRILC